MKDYTGQRCEIDTEQCRSSPCQHNGRCEDLNAAFQCNCYGTGYSGTTCSTGMYIFLAGVKLTTVSIM